MAFIKKRSSDHLNAIVADIPGSTASGRDRSLASAHHGAQEVLVNQTPDNASINAKLGEHIGGSRADRALLQDSGLDTRWMRSWKIVPREGGASYRIESRKLYFRRQYPSYEAAEDALARELAFRTLVPYRDEADQRWRIRQRRDPGLVVSQETWPSFTAVTEYLDDAKQCKALLKRLIMLSDKARRESARERGASREDAGLPPFPAGWEASAEEDGWHLYKRGKPADAPVCQSRDEALDKAREGYVRDRFCIVGLSAGGAIARVVPGSTGCSVFKEGFASTLEADAYLREHIQDFFSLATERKPRPASDVQRIPFAEARREGPARRDGPAEPSAFLTTFGFHGVEFGLWNSQAERQRLLDKAWDGLMDLAGVLGVPPKALSLDGQLSLAFGARGNGGFASAHYEYGHAVINLTKRGGAGCLAHEWFHALDHYLGRKSGYASSVRTVLADGGTGYVVPSPEKATYSGQWSRPFARYQPFGNLFDDAWDSLRRAVYGRRLSSDYYQHAAELDRGRRQAYWAKPQEMLARAFEAWVEDSIEAQGRRSEFLVNGTRRAVGDITPYPEGLERSELAAAFREFAGCTASLLNNGAEPRQSTDQTAEQPAAPAGSPEASSAGGA